MTESPVQPMSHSGDLTLGDILTVSDAPPRRSVVAIRHTKTKDGRLYASMSPQELLFQTASQPPKWKGLAGAALWLVFVADGQSRSRFVMAYENAGPTERPGVSETDVVYDLVESKYLGALHDRLVIEWTSPLSWYFGGVTASRLKVLEISDPTPEPFPGFEHLILTHDKLQAVVSEKRFEGWQTALGAVEGIYLIADTSTGKLYVGQAAGGTNILGRWTAYATNGHGGNRGQRELLSADPDHTRHFQYSLLRVYGRSTPEAEIDAAESHFKTALLTRHFGLNHN